jgi:tetratricopeptide (TPR) repeat protein
LAVGARSFWLRGPLLAIGAGLSVAIVMQALPGLGVGRPDPAVQVRQAAAQMNWPSPQDQASAQATAREALSRSPMEAQAVSLLAQGLIQAGRRAEAERMFRAATALSHRNTTADLWLFDQAMRAQDYEEAFNRADAVLRRDDQAYLPLFDAMYSAARDPAALKPLAARLALAPPWRVVFFARLFTPNTAPAFVYPLFDAMREAGSPPTHGELEGYLRVLAREEKYEQAYLVWLLSMQTETLESLDYVYDGEFDGRPATAPFGWKLGGGAGGGAVLEDAPGGGRALMVNSDGYTAGTYAQQLLVLPPGQYQLVGAMQAPANAAAGELGWSVACVSATPEVLAQAPARPTDGWRRFSAAFTVPAGGCKAQMLTLKSHPGERRTTMAVWYDKLAVQPVRGSEQ